MYLSLRHFQLCPGFLAMSQSRPIHLPWKEHGMSYPICHWKFQSKYSALTKLMFLSNFSLHFIEIDASTKLDFFLMQRILLRGVGGVGINRSNFNLLFLPLSFPWPWISLVTFYVLQTADSAAASIRFSSFYESFNFVITQIEQHDLELFKAACTFVKKIK